MATIGNPGDLCCVTRPEDALAALPRTLARELAASFGRRVLGEAKRGRMALQMVWRALPTTLAAPARVMSPMIALALIGAVSWTMPEFGQTLGNGGLLARKAATRLTPLTYRRAEHHQPLPHRRCHCDDHDLAGVTHARPDLQDGGRDGR